MWVFSNWCLKFRCAIIKWARYYVYLSKAVLCTLGLVFSHSLVDEAVVSILMSYLTNEWQEDNLPKAAVFVNVQQGISAFMAIIVAHISDAHIGRLKVIKYSTAAYIIGLLILALWKNTGMFFLAAVLLAIGKAGRDPPLKAFLAHQLTAEQLTEHKQNMDIDEERVKARRTFGWRVAGILGATVSLIWWIVINDWTRILYISAAVMAVAYLVFRFGVNFDHYNEEPTGSPFALIYKVLKEAILNSYLDQINTASGFFKWFDLDKATLSSHCTETDVNQVKWILSLVPMWTTIFFYGVVGATASTFFVEQSNNMDAQIGNYFKIPIIVFNLFQSLTCFTISYLMNLLISKWWSEANQQHVTLVRIGVGLVCSILCCITAWQVEHRRLFVIEEFGILDPIPMSILWLVPQYFLLGLMDACAEEGLSDFYYYLVPESMKLYESPFKACVLGIGNFLSLPLIFVCRRWFDDTINTSHLDKYFLMLALLGCGNLCFYILVCYKYYAWEETPEEDGEMEDVKMEEGLANFGIELSDSTSFIGNSSRSNWMVGERSLSIPDFRKAAKIVPVRSPTFS